MSDQYDDHLGVDEEYADELQERIDPPGATGPVQKVREHFAADETHWTDNQQIATTQGIVFLANAVREIRRRSENHSVEKMATALLLDDIEGAAEQGQLYKAFRQEDAGDFLDGLVEYVMGKARQTIGVLQED